MTEKDGQLAHEQMPAPGANTTRERLFKRGRFGSDPWELVAAGLLSVIALIGVSALALALLSEDSNAGRNAGPGRSQDVRILAPLDGDVVSAPFSLNVESPTRRIADPTLGIPEAAHFHAFVDVHPFTPSGEVIPEGEGIYHFWEESLTLDLPAGIHQIIVVLGDNNEVRLPDATVMAIEVTVE